MRRLYLDANGSSPLLGPAHLKINQLLGLVGNPSSFHEQGRRLRALIDDARDFIAASLQAKAREVVFTSGASEANRMIVDVMALEARRVNRVLKVKMSPFEHPSLLKPVIALADQGLLNLDIFEVSPDGDLDWGDINKADLVICCQAHNETGIVPDLSALSSQLSEHTILISDISQGWSRLPVVSARVDVMSFSAQKMGGLAGCGGLVMRSRAAGWLPPWLGGGQERGFRPGTESWLLIAAMGEAARFIDEQRQKNAQLAPIRDYFERELLARVKLKIIGNLRPRLPNTSALCFANQDPDALRIACDMAGLSVGFGAACSGAAPDGSFALKRLGLSLSEEKSTIRFSLPTDTSYDDLDETCRRLMSGVLQF